ncbi:hypothetical protein [Gordonia sp. (in: high G+C Gram-positive bacteria)]|uniref:hypothetical protein n=1 Tax=Gordonia sp. (in: high G+C Gram-positive bacteria) TaxID=84139 RepID=UPI003F974D48
MIIRLIAIGVAAVGAMLVTGCNGADGTAVRASGGNSTAATTATATTASDPGECATTTDAYLTATQKDGEPAFSVPVVDGWNRISRFEDQLTRLAVADKSLTVDNFAPNYVVTVEKAPAVGRAEFDRQLQALSRVAVGGSVHQHAESTTCGFPSLIVDYRLQVKPGIGTHATVLIVSIPEEPSPTTATLTIQTADPDNAEYSAAKKSIIDGFRVEK